MASRELQEKVVIVTGAAGGIGAAYARGVAGAGAKVVVADLDAAGAERVAASIRAAGGEATAVGVDIASVASTLAMELGPLGIRINAIAPGPIDTPALRDGVPAEVIDGIVARMALARRGRPDDLVGTCLFLLSEASAWMTGQILTVDGGHSFRV